MSKEFWKAVGVRALRTFCQSAISVIGVSVTMNDVKWGVVLSTALLASIVSVLTSIATGLPEVSEEKANE